MKQSTQVTLAVLLVACLVIIIGWLMAGNRGTSGTAHSSKMEEALNPALDIGFSYSPEVFSLAEFDARAEFPMRLDADGWGLYGKRIKGLGVADPKPYEYDLVGTQHADVFEKWFKLERVSEDYEDAEIQGRLALHNRVVYRRTPDSLDWPSYFPESMEGQRHLYIDGWALFTADDLYYFYAISPSQLGEVELGACQAVLDSLQFSILLDTGSDGTEEEEPAEPEPGPETGTEGQ